MTAPRFRTRRLCSSTMRGRKLLSLSTRARTRTSFSATLRSSARRGTSTRPSLRAMCRRISPPLREAATRTGLPRALMPRRLLWDSSWSQVVQPTTLWPRFALLVLLL
eukprot:Amastigsp_a351219_3.p2 type:complete len:108 gc:universal Amastigsp_a351219_3:792-469(-)